MAKIVWIGITEAAKRLGRHRSQVKIWAAKGKFPDAHKPGLEWILPEHEVEKLRLTLSAKKGFSEGFVYKPEKARKLRESAEPELTLAQVAALIGVAPRTLMRWEAGKTFPAPGPHIFCYERLLRQWEAAQELKT